MAMLLFEISRDGEEWSPVGELHSGDQYGSISDQHDDGSSDVYIFGVDPTENVGEVKRSLGGIDIETSETREINSIGLELVARLDPGEHLEMMIKTRRSVGTMLIRFTYS